MKKLVFQYYWSDDCICSGTATIPFEYSSIDDFIFMILQKTEEYRKNYIEKYGDDKFYRNGYIEILGIDINVGDLEYIIESNSSVYTLEDWFEKFKK